MYAADYSKELIQYSVNFIDEGYDEKYSSANLFHRRNPQQSSFKKPQQAKQRQ